MAAKARRPFSLFAIENPSDHSPANRALIDELVGTGDIEGAYFPQRNAVFNSLHCALAHDIFDLWARFDYIVLSDGDLHVDPAFIDVEMDLLARHPAISSASMRVDIRQWNPQSPHFPAAVAYSAPLIAGEARGEDFVDSAGGFWMRMFRTAQLRRLVELFDRNGLRLRDTSIDQFFRTFGLSPACALKTTGVELPSGPYFRPADPAKSGAEMILRKSGRVLNLWNHDVEPAGRYRLGAGAPVEADLPLAAPCSPEQHRRLADLPPELASTVTAQTAAIVRDTLEWNAEYQGLVLIPDPRLDRAFIMEGGRAVVAPFALIETDEAYPGHLQTIHFDARDLKRTRRATLPRLFAVARKALVEGGLVIIEAPDWGAVGRQFASINLKLEESLRTEAPTLLVKRAARASVLSRTFEQRDLLFELASLIRYAAEAGLYLQSVERPPADDDAPTIRCTFATSAPSEPTTDAVVASVTSSLAQRQPGEDD
ncbi:MAG: hypothetical protein B7Y99_07595 [Caulobacterales bacterium 32-69-10]|nr:MAG: hypothetical protein B7Y99_07595 [Caulobacterales bacterium 32-69-10]